MTRGATRAFASACGVIAFIAMTPAAQANDLTVTYNGTDGTYQGRWIDGSDQLCARTTGAQIRVQIEPASGSGSTYSISTSGSSWRCTANLSIPEDRSYRMYLQFYSHGTWNALPSNRQFYT